MRTSGFFLALLALSNGVIGQWWLPYFLFGSFFKDCLSPPMECPNENITFYLYTRSTADSPELLNVSDVSSIKSAGFIKGSPVKILIHGYTGFRDYSPNTEIRPAYLSYGEYNVISIDYGPLVKEPCYVQGAYNTPLVGMCIAQLLDILIENNVVPLSDIHVIGFSLGAQVAGQIGLFLKSGKLPRITGLDPAMPLFVTPWKSSKLDSTDADFVDVIHTNAGYKGKIDTSGDVDFYTNGGAHQPGCDAPGIPSADSCAHARAAEYFAESISSEIGFWGTPCGNWGQYVLGMCSLGGNESLVLMGEHVPLDVNGSYFLFTNSKPPYARGMPGSFNYTIDLIPSTE